MAIMITFLVLSIILVIGTAIYLSRQKKNVNNNIKQTSSSSTTEKGKTTRKKQLRDLFNIQIKDNIICSDNRYSNIIRLGNIDYNMLSNSEQDAIENVLIQVALSIDYPIQFFSTTEYIDTSKIISLIKNNKTVNNNIAQYQKYLIDYLQNLMENRSISVVKNYAIISYDGLYKDAVDELNRRSNLFKGNLLRAKIVCEILNEDDIQNLLYRELNKNSALNISILKEGGKNLYVGKKQKKKTRRN